ncbi:AFL043Cp [Eremothecium gossypii ATCC 10895]|uniref:AFL043Cp n=1 Tax=Eremothecium gossypii (strain ATCC 10895 / CBS 109.51 / FGSC 9923 / NRRL Y-1056) TaxID=284811 RepID=Q754W0_EREGS|nr:AFL043Cp [Eremothecium gossypii ATCC 10895]AAS53329.2 AFL043Cp [Eremothecium gossypii ATCC 10895]
MSEVETAETASIADRLRAQYASLPVDSDSVLDYVLVSKLATNLACIREQTVARELQDGSGSEDYDKELGKLELDTLHKLYRYRKGLISLYNEQKEAKARRRYSVDFDSADPRLDEESEAIGDTGQLNGDDDSLQQLRQRLIGGQEGKEDREALEKQMQVQDDVQRELVSDMAQLVTSLRRGAEAFQNALAEDSTVLRATELGLQATSQSLSTLGTKLKKYNRSRVGFFFYMGCAFFIIMSLLVTYLIIRIFPKM